jgi:hypothetical protein
MVWDRHDLIGELWYKPGTWVTRLTGRTGA